jgi:menaquinone-dependent protoporphyrinogen IX oxidase
LKVFVIYDSKYGNTKLVAMKIVEGLNQAGGLDVAVEYVKDVDPQKLVGYDALVIGAPNHMGRPSWTMRKFVDSLFNAHLDAQWFAVFDTYFQRERYFQKAMKKLDHQISERLPNLVQITPGLSVRVKGVNGPVVDGELAKAKEFGERIAVELKKQEK